MTTYTSDPISERLGDRRARDLVRCVTQRNGVFDTATSVDKALALLTAFSGDARLLGVSDLARRTGLPKSTAFRLLGVLVAWGLVERVGTRYSVGMRLGKLAELAGSPVSMDIRDIALPYLQDLYETTHETVHLAVSDGLDILYVEKIFGHNRVSTPSRVGGRINAGCTALGKAMLAFADAEVVGQVFQHMRPLTAHTIASANVLGQQLEAVRRLGVAYDREESSIGVTCVGAPVLGPDSRVIAAISVTGPVYRFDPAGRAGAVTRAAQGIAKAAAYARGDGPTDPGRVA
ncbi:IclR family transcriptional regulator [Rhodococcus erythropolis]|uniref:IclR family transcriptional regulator n=1 Tax=Rhodococcus erythropolis TaxID=1833 RepID=UPI001BE7405C|nr:IclR family transcriptional regulator [Rhodococcus erythropolis]MBT2268970.1 IclR family transcriptional regulator [Rhodococcus erythropolis]